MLPAPTRSMGSAMFVLTTIPPDCNWGKRLLPRFALLPLHAPTCPPHASVPVSLSPSPLSHQRPGPDELWCPRLASNLQHSRCRSAATNSTLTCAACVGPLACKQVLFNVTSNITSLRLRQGSACECSTIPNPGDCNKTPECKHTGECGCIPSKCSCGDTECISECTTRSAAGTTGGDSGHWYPDLNFNGTQETMDMKAGVCQNTTGEHVSRVTVPRR